MEEEITTHTQKEKSGVREIVRGAWGRRKRGREMHRTEIEANTKV